MQKELKILLLSTFLLLLAGELFGPIYAVFVEDIGGDLLTAGTAYAAFSIAAGLLTFVIANLEDHLKHQEKMIVFGYVLHCFGFLGYLLIKTSIDLFFVQIIFGVAGAIQWPVFDGVFSKHLDKGKFASEWGIYESLNYIIAGIAAVTGGFIANFYGFRVLFGIMFGISLLGLIVSLFLLKRKRHWYHR